MSLGRRPSLAPSAGAGPADRKLPSTVRFGGGAGTWSRCPHFGQSRFFPIDWSGHSRTDLHLGHPKRIIHLLPPRAGFSHLLASCSRRTLTLGHVDCNEGRANNEHLVNAVDWPLARPASVSPE